MQAKQNKMAQQSNNNPLGEISTIRDILMGEQMNEYNSRFKEMEVQMMKMQKDNKAFIKEMEDRQINALEQLRSDVFKRLDELEELLSQKSEELDEKIDDTTSSDRSRLGELLQELGQQLSGL